MHHQAVCRVLDCRCRVCALLLPHASPAVHIDNLSGVCFRHVAAAATSPDAAAEACVATVVLAVGAAAKRRPAQQLEQSGVRLRRHSMLLTTTSLTHTC